MLLLSNAPFVITQKEIANLNESQVSQPFWHEFCNGGHLTYHKYITDHFGFFFALFWEVKFWFNVILQKQLSIMAIKDKYLSVIEVGHANSYLIYTVNHKLKVSVQVYLYP